MNDEMLEQRLRRMRPAVMPEDLCAALQETPVKYRAFPTRKVLAMAAVLLLGVSVCWFNRPMAEEPQPVLTIRHKESTLLSSKRLALRQENAVLWEQCEQEWLDRETALCSNHPAVVRFRSKRREVVWQPVEFQ